LDNVLNAGLLIWTIIADNRDILLFNARQISVKQTFMSRDCGYCYLYTSLYCLQL